MSIFTLTCTLCGEEFESNNAKSKVCKRTHTSNCAVCGKEYVIVNTKRPAVTCSATCAARHRCATSPVKPRFECECVLCGETFLSNSRKGKYCPKDHYKSCVVCGKEFLIKKPNRPAVACSSSCASALTHTDESAD